ncbi:membrane protein [Betaproteobacteria bacterium]|nr:membrane protein [Betaproteobacteria bacterium]
MAQMPFSPCGNDASVECTDASVEMLRQIFGEVITKLATGADPETAEMGLALLPTLLYHFNSGIVIVASLIVSYVSMMGVVNTANDGEAMGKSWSSVWTPVRIVIGGGSLLPTAAGYSFIQLVVLLFALWGVGFANTIYEAGMAAGLLNPAGVAVDIEGSTVGNYFGIREFAVGFLPVAYCAKAANTIYNDGSTLASVKIGTQGKPDFEYRARGGIDQVYEYKDREGTTNVAGAAAICGSYSFTFWDKDAPPAEDYSAEEARIIALAATPIIFDPLAGVEAGNAALLLEQRRKTDEMNLALWDLRESVQIIKQRHVAAMIAELDAWVQKWPTSANDGGWDKVSSEELNRIIDKYEQAIATELMKIVTGGSDLTSAAGKALGVQSALKAFVDETTKEGWSMAGGWFHKVGKLRQDIKGSLAAPVGRIAAPSILGLDASDKAKLLRKSVHTATVTINARAAEKTGAVVRKPQLTDLSNKVDTMDVEKFNPQDFQKSIESSFDSTISSTMESMVNGFTGVNSLGKKDNAFFCGPGSESLGGAMNRMKCVGDNLTEFLVVVDIVKLSLIAITTKARLVAAALSSVSVLGTQVKADLLVTPIWDLIMFLVIPLLEGVTSLLRPVAFYFSVFLPTLPYTIFMIVVVGWVLGVLQSVIAAPLWAIMHMTPDRTFIGSQSQGYLLILSIFVRPALAVIGLFAAILVSDPVINYLATAFFSMQKAVLAAAGESHGLAQFQLVFWVSVFAATLLPILYMIFSLPQTLPGEVLKWIGAGVSDLGQTQASSEMRAGGAKSNQHSEALRNSVGAGVSAFQNDAAMRIEELKGRGKDKKEVLSETGSGAGGTTTSQTTEKKDSEETKPAEGSEEGKPGEKADPANAGDQGAGGAGDGDTGGSSLDHAPSTDNGSQVVSDSNSSTGQTG